MPKRGCDVTSCEITRFFRLNNSGLCQVISMTVPRKVFFFFILLKLSISPIRWGLPKMKYLLVWSKYFSLNYSKKIYTRTHRVMYQPFRPKNGSQERTNVQWWYRWKLPVSRRPVRILRLAHRHFYLFLYFKIATLGLIALLLLRCSGAEED